MGNNPPSIHHRSRNLLTRRDVVEGLGCSEGTIRRDVKRGELREMRFGLSARYRVSDIGDWLDRTRPAWNERAKAELMEGEPL